VVVEEEVAEGEEVAVGARDGEGNCVKRASSIRMEIVLLRKCE